MSGPGLGASLPFVIVDAAETLRELGASDCEQLGSGLLAQPVNAITSFAYVLVGVVAVASAHRRNRLTAEVWAFAVLLAGVGLGSVAFHGPQPRGARVLHDLPILLVAVFISCHDLRLLRPRGPSVWTYFVPAALIACAVTLVSADAVTASTALAVVAVVVLEVLVYRTDRRRLEPTRRRWSATFILSVIALASASWLLGRTGSPACDPDGLLQFHGLWHLLSALLFGAWGAMAFLWTGQPTEQLIRTR